MQDHVIGKEQMNMAQRIDGKAVSAKVRAAVAQEVAALKERGVTPGLAVVIVGDDPASRIYVNNKKKACQATGIGRVCPARFHYTGGAAGLSGPA